MVCTLRASGLRESAEVVPLRRERVEAMKNWFVKNLGDAMLADDARERIRLRVLSACAGAETPEGMLAFVRHETHGHLYCELKVYFSPMLIAVAKEFNAEPCEKPSPDGLSLLVGSTS